MKLGMARSVALHGLEGAAVEVEAHIGQGLPQQPIDLSTLRDLLLERSASSDLKDQVWCELIRRARTGEPSWVVGCVGMAMPGLKSIAAHIIRSSPSHLADDIVSELLTEYRHLASAHRRAPDVLGSQGRPARPRQGDPPRPV